jgi:hypothetical protein
VSQVESPDAYLAHRVGARLRTTRWRLALVAAALAGVLAGVWFEHGTDARIVLAAVLAVAFPAALFLWLANQQQALADGVWCIEQEDVLFELEHGELVVALRDHLTDADALDFLLERSRFVL